MTARCFLPITLFFVFCGCGNAPLPLGNENSKKPVISVVFNGNELVVDGKDNIKLKDYWREKVKALTDAEDVTKKSIQARESRLLLELDRDLPYAIFAQLLTEASQQNYVHFDIVLHGSLDPVSVNIRNIKIPDGEHKLLRLSLKSNEAVTPDIGTLKLSVKDEKSLIVRIRADPDVALEEILKLISILAPDAIGNEIGFYPSLDPATAIVHGNHNVACTWKMETAAFIRGNRVIEIPEEILRKAEQSESK